MNLESLWHDSADRLGAFLRAPVIDAAADDIRQDVFLKMHRRIGPLRGAGIQPGVRKLFQMTSVGLRQGGPQVRKRRRRSSRMFTRTSWNGRRGAKVDAILGLIDELCHQLLFRG